MMTWCMLVFTASTPHICVIAYFFGVSVGQTLHAFCICDGNCELFHSFCVVSRGFALKEEKMGTFQLPRGDQKGNFHEADAKTVEKHLSALCAEIIWIKREHQRRICASRFKPRHMSEPRCEEKWSSLTKQQSAFHSLEFGVERKEGSMLSLKANASL